MEVCFTWPMRHTKTHFFIEMQFGQRNAIRAALLYSGFNQLGTILTISIQKFSRIPPGAQFLRILNDTRLRFPD